MSRISSAIVFLTAVFFTFFLVETVTTGKRAGAEERLVVKPALRDVILTGYTRGQTTATLASEVSGKVLKINYEVGQVIDELPFLSIDSTFIDLDINSTRHSLEQLKVTREKRKSKVAYLDKEFRRIDKLFRRGSSPESRRDTSKEDLDQARFDVEAVSVEIAIAQTRLKELIERKKRHEIRAPDGWTVVAKLTEPGELVSVNTPVVRVADYEHLVVPLSVSAQELDALQKLPSIFDVTLDGKPASASINWINPEFNEKTRKLNIELILRNYPGLKRGGLICRLALQTAAEGLWIPKQAIVNRYDNPRVFLKESGAEIKVLILGQTENYFIVADEARLPPGTLLQAGSAFRPKLIRDPEH